MDTQSKAIADVLKERQRQIESEGWSCDHDDKHTDESLILAAICYALPQSIRQPTKRGETFDDSGGRGDCPVWREKIKTVPILWPISWSIDWWKPKTKRRNLVKATALLIAEIERIDRQKTYDTATGLLPEEKKRIDSVNTKTASTDMLPLPENHV